MSNLENALKVLGGLPADTKIKAYEHTAGAYLYAAFRFCRDLIEANQLFADNDNNPKEDK